MVKVSAANNAILIAAYDGPIQAPTFPVNATPRKLTSWMGRMETLRSLVKRGFLATSDDRLFTLTEAGMAYVRTLIS